MSAVGHQRRFAIVSSTSALPPLATVERTSQIGSEGPEADIAPFPREPS